MSTPQSFQIPLKIAIKVCAEHILRVCLLIQQWRLFVAFAKVGVNFKKMYVYQCVGQWGYVFEFSLVKTSTQVYYSLVVSKPNSTINHDKSQQANLQCIG